MLIRGKRGGVQWYWIIIGIIIAIVFALFILGIYTDFGTNIKSSLADIFKLTDTSGLNAP